jgi:hypothetical protein
MSTKVSKRPAMRTALARAQAYALLARAFGRPDAWYEADVAEGCFGDALAEALAALGHQELADAAAAISGVPEAPLTDEFVRLWPSARRCAYETECGGHVFMRAQVGESPASTARSACVSPPTSASGRTTSRRSWSSCRCWR